MPSIESGVSRPVGAVPVKAIEARITPRPESPGVPAQQAAAPAMAASARLLDPGKPPIDAERVAQVRKAVESGNYPLVPARIADAMIAAGILLRSDPA